MNRRKDGRELFEVFRETVAKPAPPAPEAQPAPPRVEPRVEPRAEPRLEPRAPEARVQAIRSEPQAAPRRGVMPPDEPEHVIRLGERRQVAITLSNGWTYGLMIFLVLLLAGAFATGRRFAPIPEPVKEVQAPDEFMAEASRVADVTRLNTPASLPAQPAPQPAPSYAPPEPAPAPPSTPPVTGQASYALCLITYRNRADSRQSAEDVVKFLKTQGFSDARSLVDKARGNLIVAVGSFETTAAADAKDTKVRISALSYKGTSFKDAYFTSLKNYQ
jgi:hypothetical protein